MNVITNIENADTPLDQRAPKPSFYESMFAMLRRRIWFVAFVIIPTVAAVIYYGLIASDIYVSESSFVIKTPGAKAPQVSTLANLIQTTGLGAGQSETSEVIGYIRSRSALENIGKVMDVRGAYTNEAADRLARYPFPFTSDKFDNLYKYYHDMVEVNQDHETSLVMLKAKAFSADEAWKINKALLDQSEALVNRLNRRAQARAITEGEERVKIAERRLKNVRVQLAQYRNSQDLMDPERQATGIIDIVSKLTIERAELQSRLDVMRRSTPNHPALPSLRSQIAAIDAAIGGQTGRVVGGSGAIASKVGGYEELVVEQQFATQMLNAANASMEQARSEAVKQQFYLERVVEPNLPDIAAYPKRIKGILVIFGSVICLYFIAWMLVVGILEHAPED